MTTQESLQALIDAYNKFNIVTVTNTYVVLDTDEEVRCDGTFTVTLPAATGSALGYAIKNIGTGTITLAAAGSDTIDGEATQTILTLDAITVVDADAGVWDILK